MRDSRFPASVVAKFRIAARNFRSRFGSARRAQNETAWRASYDFPLEKYIGNTTGTRAWKGSRVRQAVRICDRFWSTLAPPFLPLSLRIPAPHTPPPLPNRYSSPRRPRPRLRSPPSSPRRYSLTFHTLQHTFHPPAPHQPPNRPASPYCSPSCSYATISSYARIPACTSLPKIFPCHAISRGRCVSTVL